jgi:hypothetical protein
VDGQRKLERLRRDALQSYFGSVRSKRQVDGTGRSGSGDGSQEGKWLGTFNSGKAGGPTARIFGKGNNNAHHVSLVKPHLSSSHRTLILKSSFFLITCLPAHNRSRACASR